MTKDELAQSYGFEIVDSEYEYYKKFVRRIHLVVYYDGWKDSKWQVKLMEHDGGIYFAMKEIARFEVLEDALKAANKLNPNELKSLIDDDNEDELEEEA